MKRLIHTLMAMLCLASAICFAQAFPSKPVTLVVPYAPGGSTDIMARLVAQYLPAALGQPVTVENRTGGGGVVGWNSVAKASADGYTLLTSEMSLPISAALLPNLPFNPKTAFSHLTVAAQVPHVLVVDPNLPVKNLREFVAYAKANPGKLNYGSGGNGTNTHMGAELFKSLTGTFLTHIPYRGGGAALAGLLAGQVQMQVTALPGALPHIKSGKLRPLMVTANERSPALPEVPSAKELGLDMDMPFWLGFAAPAGTPTPVLAKLHKDITTTLQQADVKKRLSDMGFSVVASSPEAATQLVEKETERWAKIIKAAGIKPD